MSRPLLAEAESLLGRAAALARPGRFQLETAIQSAHALRAVTGAAPWGDLAMLYRTLLEITPSVGARIAYAAALHQADDTPAAEAALATVPPSFSASYQPDWAVRAQLLLRSGRREEARRALERAAGLTQDEATRRFLRGLASSAGQIPVERPVGSTDDTCDPAWAVS